MSEPISRRKFLKTGCLTAAAVGLTLCGTGTLVATHQPEVNQPSTLFGETTMNNRVLVAYATKAGSTAEIATRIGQVIAKRQVAVEVKPIDQVTDLSAYRAVVLGSAIRMGTVLSSVTRLVENNQASLKEKPFSAFVVCLTLKEDTAENQNVVNTYLDSVRALAQPGSEGFFSGVLDLKKLSLLDRLMAKAMKAPSGDYRNWDQIDAWASQVPL